MSDHETTLRDLAGYLLRTSDLYPRGSVMGQKQEAQIAACEAGADALRRGTWQPIESAPKDWTHVLLACGRTVAEGYWLEGANEWLYANTSIDDESCIIDNPTHWLPLPDAPTEPTR